MQSYTSYLGKHLQNFSTFARLKWANWVVLNMVHRLGAPESPLFEEPVFRKHYQEDSALPLGDNQCPRLTDYSWDELEISGWEVRVVDHSAGVWASVRESKKRFNF